MMLRLTFYAKHLCYVTLNIFEIIKRGNKRTSINMLCPLFTRQGRETKKEDGHNIPILFLLCVFIHSAVCFPKGPHPLP